jgi:drug/metabolite transporter (DMT)-like permease
VFTTIIAIMLGRERSSWTTWVGLGVCTVGLLVMAQGRGGIGAIGPSAALVVLAALSFAMYTLVSKPLLMKYRPLEVTTYSVVAGALPFIVFARGSLNALATASSGELGTLLYLAVVPGGIAYLLWSRAVKGLAPGVAARFLYLVPVLGVPVAWAWVGEAPTIATLVGGLVIVAGVAVATVRLAPRTIVIREPHVELGTSVAPEVA